MCCCCCCCCCCSTTHDLHSREAYACALHRQPVPARPLALSNASQPAHPLPHANISNASQPAPPLPHANGFANSAHLHCLMPTVSPAARTSPLPLINRLASRPASALPASRQQTYGAAPIMALSAARVAHRPRRSGCTKSSNLSVFLSIYLSLSLLPLTHRPRRPSRWTTFSTPATPSPSSLRSITGRTAGTWRGSCTSE